MATLSILERRIDKHLKENSNQIKYFKSELQCLKTQPNPRAPQPCSGMIKAKEIPKNKRPEQITKASAKSLKGNEKGSSDTKTSKKPVKISFQQFHVNDAKL